MKVAADVTSAAATLRTQLWDVEFSALDRHSLTEAKAAATSAKPGFSSSRRGRRCGDVGQRFSHITVLAASRNKKAAIKKLLPGQKKTSSSHPIGNKLNDREDSLTAQTDLATRYEKNCSTVLRCVSARAEPMIAALATCL